MTTRITVSLPDYLVEQVRAAVAAGWAASMSEYVAEALLEYGPPESLQKLLADMDEEFGPVPPETLAWADKVLGFDQADEA